MTILLHRTEGNPFFDGKLCPERFAAAEPLHIASFREESGAERPDTTAKLLETEEGIYGLFEVKGETAHAKASAPNDSVCLDSCVEFFVSPNIRLGYCNFEFSVNGTMLASFIRDHRRVGDGFADFRFLTEEERAGIRVYPERIGCFADAQKSDWKLGFFLPYSLLLSLFRTAKPETGMVWRANLFKCSGDFDEGDCHAKAHYASLFSVSELNFHLPQCFGNLVFD